MFLDVCFESVAIQGLKAADLTQKLGQVIGASMTLPVLDQPLYTDKNHDSKHNNSNNGVIGYSTQEDLLLSVSIESR